MATVSRWEFIAMMGMMFATIAFSIDAMLPALPEIAQELTPSDPNRAQLILTSFLFGMGIGTLFAGPLSDALGRKAVIMIGATLYCSGALLGYLAQDLTWILAARVLQGLGAAGPRVVSLAMARDLFSGRAMAQIVSYAMLVFTIFPAIAPLIGAWIILGFGWRAIFLAFLVFSFISVAWLGLRQPETLPRDKRRPLALNTLWSGLRETLIHRQMQLSILVQACVFAGLFGSLSSIQQIFDHTYDRGDSFPLWFGLIALAAAPAGPINGLLVMRLGMRPLIRITLILQAGLALLLGVLFALGAFGEAAFWIYLGWNVTLFATAAFTIGNLNALALEPLGHIAGMAASVMGAIATVIGAALGAAVGALFDGTPMPLFFALAGLMTIGAAVMLCMPRARSTRG
ncbi:Bcr/CflA family efflux MFS transporter [Rhodobacterales bacterium LSUCC0031]|nr:Bcr/CflA family efflux MFS transporter [Rhodobacterales bacterium LSUCC0031]